MRYARSRPLNMATLLLRKEKVIPYRKGTSCSPYRDAGEMSVCQEGRNPAQDAGPDVVGHRRVRALVRCLLCETGPCCSGSWPGCTRTSGRGDLPSRREEQTTSYMPTIYAWHLVPPIPLESRLPYSPFPR